MGKKAKAVDKKKPSHGKELERVHLKDKQKGAAKKDKPKKRTNFKNPYEINFKRLDFWTMSSPVEINPALLQDFLRLNGLGYSNAAGYDHTFLNLDGELVDVSFGDIFILAYTYILRHAHPGEKLQVRAAFLKQGMGCITEHMIMSLVAFNGREEYYE